MTTSNGRIPLEPEQLRRYGRLAALLFGTGALATLPAAFLLDPVPGAEILIVTALGVSSGLVAWFLPWERMPGWTLDALTGLATLEVLLACHVVDETYRLLYFITVAFAALALPTRVRMGAQLALVVAALVVPVGDDIAREQVRIALLFTPVLVIVSGAVRYLRETLESREGASRAFAREALELSIRLRGGTPGREQEGAALDALERRAVERLR